MSESTTKDPIAELPDDERQALRAFRAKKEAAAKAEANGMPYWHDWSVEDQIKDHYMHARGTIQDYARIYKLTVDEVLTIVGHSNLAQVTTVGDMVDARDLGPNDAPIKAFGNPAKVPFSTN